MIINDCCYYQFIDNISSSKNISIILIILSIYNILIFLYIMKTEN